MHHHVTQLRDLPVWSNFFTTANFRRVDYLTKLLTCMFLVSKCSIQSYFDVFLLEHPWQRQFPALVPRRYDVMPSDDVMILAPARLWRQTFRAVFSCSFLPKEFICFVFTTWLCEQHSHIVWMVPCQVNLCFIIQYITRQNHIYSWGIFTISETFSKSGDHHLIGRIIMHYLCLIREIVS